MNLWNNQVEALEFMKSHPHCMLDMEMGTGKTRVAIEFFMKNDGCHNILVVCPKSVMPVWRQNLEKFYHGGTWRCWEGSFGTCSDKAEAMIRFLSTLPDGTTKAVCVVNYESVWRWPIGDSIRRVCFDTIILDESHRAKSAGSKVSKYLAMVGKKAKFRVCLSGTPMANSPLDVYGQYRFLDPSIFGTNYNQFLQQYAVMGGPERQFIVGYKNQKELKEKFQSIAYSCHMRDVASYIKLPDHLPPVKYQVEIPSGNIKVSKKLGKEMIAECQSGGVITAKNVLVKLLRLQQIASGFCLVQDGPLCPTRVKEMNTSKKDALQDILQDISSSEPVVVFCVFQHDLDAIRDAAVKAGRTPFELSGRTNDLEHWQFSEGAVLAVQIQAGAEGVDMTMANHAIYFSLPHSLALYEQSRARLYRPGQKRPVSFIHLIAEGTVDEAMYKSLVKKKDIIEEIKDGTFDFGFVK